MSLFGSAPKLFVYHRAYSTIGSAPVVKSRIGEINHVVPPSTSVSPSAGSVRKHMPLPSWSVGGSPRPPPPTGRPRCHAPVVRPGLFCTVQPVFVWKLSVNVFTMPAYADAEYTLSGAENGLFTTSPPTVSALK